MWGEVVSNNVEKYIINGEDFDPNQFVVDVLTVGMESFAIGSSIKGLKNTSSQPWCFVAGTAVQTAEGHKAIEDIEVGDMVLSENPETGDVEYKEVLETYENETDELIHVHINGEDIVTTPSHPFYVNQFGWTRAAQLRAGDVLVLSNGEYVVVEFIQHEILESPVKVYNLEVDDYHTYFVGESSVLVHNGCEDDIPQNTTNIVPQNDILKTKGKRWKVGDPIDAPTMKGEAPKWSTVQKRYWKNEAQNNPGNYSASNLDRMKRGRAPLVQYQGNGKWYSMELHHVDPQRNNGANTADNLLQVAPWEHDAIEEYRHFKP